jgi:hypothetical protein
MATHSAGIRINVTAEQIKDSEQRNSSRCMIATAIMAALPHAKHVSVDIQTIRYSDPIQRTRYFHLTPRKVQQVIIDFDQGKNVEPFSFDLRSPHIVPMNLISQDEARKDGIETRNRSDKQMHEIVQTTDKRGWPAVRIGRHRQFGLRALVP